MGVEPAWMADLEDGEEPEPEYWEDDELTPEELAAWGELDSAGPCAEGSVPDLIAAVVAAGGDPALMSDAELVGSLTGWHAVAARAAARELRATEELMRRRRPRVWDRRADRAENARQDPEADTPEPADSTQGDPVIHSGPAAPGETSPERVMPAVVPSREAAAEVALALTATEYSARVQVELTADLSRRLPIAFGELDAGRADLHRLKVLAEGTQFLSDEDAGRVDALLAPQLGQWTTGELKDKIRRALNKIDPGAADRRREHAERKARFALYGNPDQTATATVERMPAHLGAAVKARVNAIARAAKAAGMTDPMPLLEAKVATGLLLDTLPDIPPPNDAGGRSHDPGPAGPWDDGWPADWFPTEPAPVPASNDASGPIYLGSAPEGQPGLTPPDPGDSETGPANFTADPDPDPNPGAEGAAPVNFGSSVQMGWPAIPAQAGRDGPGCHGLPRWLRPKVPGRIRLTVPWRTLTGMSPEPGELSWIGPITPSQARDLAAAAGADPSCTWRLILTDDVGHATAITTLRTRRPTPAHRPGLVSEVTITIQETLAAGLGADRQTRDWIITALARLAATGTGVAPLADLLSEAIPAANLAAAEAAVRAAADTDAGGCAHSMEASGYRVPDRLRRWLNTRDRTCRNPICRQPALRCDQDHTIGYDLGGRTCTCNLGGLCRVHHQLKQLPGWQLSQDSDGTFTWTTPAGLTYRKEPHCYPV